MTENPEKKSEKAPKPTQGRGAIRQQERNARQAKSLRENLKKRKQQVRARDADDPPQN